MKVMFDNNVVLDALIPNGEFEAIAVDLLRMANEKTIYGFISASSLTDVFYVLNKKHGGGKSKAIMGKLLLMLHIAGTEPADCTDALELPMNDFEDAVIAVCSKRIGADCVVSRDEKFIKADSGVKVIRPEELIRQLR